MRRSITSIISIVPVIPVISISCIWSWGAVSRCVLFGVATVMRLDCWVAWLMLWTGITFMHRRNIVHLYIIRCRWLRLWSRRGKFRSCLPTRLYLRKMLLNDASDGIHREEWMVVEYYIDHIRVCTRRVSMITNIAKAWMISRCQRLKEHPWIRYIPDRAKRSSYIAYPNAVLLSWFSRSVAEFYLSC